MSGLSDQFHVITNRSARITMIARSQCIPNPTSLDGMGNVEWDRPKIFEREIGNRLLDRNFSCHDSRKVHRHVLIKHQSIVLGRDSMIVTIAVN